MQVTIYRGFRVEKVAQVQKLVMTFDHKTGRMSATTGPTLAPRHDLYNHSPTGFEWGYGGSGPAQLALALLAEVTGNDALAVMFHQTFKFSVVAGWQADEWRISSVEILEWVCRQLGAADPHRTHDMLASVDLGSPPLPPDGGQR